MRKTFAIFGILWIIGACLYMAAIYEFDIGWQRFPQEFIGQFLIGFVLFALPGIAVLLLIAIHRLSEKQTHLSGGANFGNAKPNSRRSQIPHQDESWIFLSYRRADSADISGRIYDRLIQEFGNHSVFKDVDSIPLGLDFRNILNQKVAKSRILIAIIGPDWSGQDQAKRRIDDPTDFVRIEVSAALERGIPVIPLLVHGTTMPQEGELPEDLKALAYRNGTVIRPDPDFNHDIKRVISGIDKLR
jgi:hypothetical protein